MNNEDEYWNSCILCVSLSFAFRGYIGGHVLKKKRQMIKRLLPFNLIKATFRCEKDKFQGRFPRFDYL